jgi:hypothetical protein
MAMAVTSLDDAIFTMNDKFRSLMLADCSAAINSLCFRIGMNTGSFATAFLYVPSAVRIGHYMM